VKWLSIFRRQGELGAIDNNLLDSHGFGFRGLLNGLIKSVDRDPFIHKISISINVCEITIGTCNRVFGSRSAGGPTGSEPTDTLAEELLTQDLGTLKKIV
jgi:hypothetical protein